jgi:hypothetical protein
MNAEAGEDRDPETLVLTIPHTPTPPNSSWLLPTPHSILVKSVLLTGEESGGRFLYPL